MQTRTRSMSQTLINDSTKATLKKASETIYDASKAIAVHVGDQIDYLSQRDVPNYSLSTATALLCGSIYMLSSNDAASVLALMGFGSATYLAIKQYGAENTYASACELASNAYSAASSKMITMFKSFTASKPANVQAPTLDQEETFTPKKFK